MRNTYKKYGSILIKTIQSEIYNNKTQRKSVLKHGDYFTIILIIPKILFIQQF